MKYSSGQQLPSVKKTHYHISFYQEAKTGAGPLILNTGAAQEIYWMFKVLHPNWLHFMEFV